MMVREDQRGGTLVVGASQAGLQLAVSLRQLGDTSPITLVGEEVHQPYQRPPLSKEYLAGAVEPESLALRAPAFYADAGIGLVTGERVTEVALPASGRPGSGVAVTATGRVLPFDRLTLTVGASPRRLTLPGADLDGVCYLRDRDDAAGLRARLAGASDVVVVGGGFIGLEVAAVARALGKAVTVVEVAERLLARAVAPVVSDFYRRAHQRRGTDVLLSAGVSAFDGEDGRVRAVRLTDGTRLPADLVLVGVGIVPRTELAAQLGLACDNGIVVDARARTGDPRVTAAGDCTVQPHPTKDTNNPGRIRLESVQNAVDQARTAAATLLGKPRQTARPVPWFWSTQDDLKLQIAGLSTGYDDYVVRGDPDSERFSVLYYRQGQLLSIDAINTPADYMTVRRALTQGATIPPTHATNPATPLKTLLTPRPAAVPLG